MKKTLLIAIAIFTLPINVQAISRTDKRSVLFDTVFFEENADVCIIASGGSLPEDVPQPYNKIFSDAADKFKAPPALVAAIFFAGEHASSWPDPPPPYGKGEAWATSPMDAKGPFQFLEPTWDYYGIDGDGDGDKDIQDLTDAAFGAANYLAANGGKVGSPAGEPGQQPGPHSIRNAIWHYNHADWYVEQVFEAYEQFSKGSSGSNSATVNTCSGNVGISADGFAFPVATTQTRIKEHPSQYWCWLKQTSCHHDYPAADITEDTGTPIVAARGGKVIAIDDYPQRLHIYGDDGRWYYYQHLQANSVWKRGIKVGMNVKAGDEIGAVGTVGDTGNGTTQHLHFDVSKVDSRYIRSSSNGYKEPKQYVIDAQKALVESFNALPAR